MIANWVDLGNLALIKVGARTIISIEDDLKEANLIKAKYAVTRDFVLRQHPWNCAIKRKVLSPLSTPPAFGFAYQFQLPEDCLRVLSIAVDERDISTPYQVEGEKKLLCNEPIVYLKYIFQVTDPTQLEDLCIEVISLYLASEIAEPLTQSLDKKKTLKSEYVDAIRKAKSTDAQENPAIMVSDSTWLQAWDIPFGESSPSGRY